MGGRGPRNGTDGLATWVVGGVFVQGGFAVMIKMRMERSALQWVLMPKSFGRRKAFGY